MILAPVRLLWWLGRWMVRRLVWTLAGLVLRGALGGSTGGLVMRGLGARGLWWRYARLAVLVGLLAWGWVTMRAAPEPPPAARTGP